MEMEEREERKRMQELREQERRQEEERERVLEQKQVTHSHTPQQVFLPGVFLRGAAEILCWSLFRRRTCSGLKRNRKNGRRRST